MIRIPSDFLLSNYSISPIGKRTKKAFQRHWNPIWNLESVCYDRVFHLLLWISLIWVNCHKVSLPSYPTVIIVRVPNIKIPVFFAQHRPERDRQRCGYRIIILLSLFLSELFVRSNTNETRSSWIAIPFER